MTQTDPCHVYPTNGEKKKRKCNTNLSNTSSAFIVNNRNRTAISYTLHNYLLKVSLCVKKN